MAIPEIIQQQKDFFSTHKTFDLEFRKQYLKKLKAEIIAHEDKIEKALWQDLHKSAFESFAAEIYLVLDELDLHLKKLKKWCKPTKHKTNIINQLAKSYVQPEPYGHVLIIAPWNYPFQLLMEPLIGALSAGNVVSLKPSEFSSNTSAILNRIISKVFPPEYVSLFEGEKEVSQTLLKEKFDYIFFTGSPRVGKIIMQSAAKHLTPVTLELGGKSPTIVEKDANLTLAARRIAWGKFINAGQTCLAPDYLFVHKEIKQAFIEKFISEIKSLYGENPKESPDYCRIISKANVQRLESLFEGSEIIYGGKTDRELKYVEPTILDKVDSSSAVMQQEIFGPLMPIMEYTDLDEVIEFINKRDKPLALYLFTASKNTRKKVLKHTSSGGACINETIMHVANPNIPFGGVGNSGIGAYHGKKSFETFSHQKSILKKSTKFDLDLRYAPYNGKLAKMKKMLKWMRIVSEI